MKIDELEMSGNPAPAIDKVLASYRGSIETALIFAKGLTYIAQQEYRLSWGVPLPIQRELKVTCPEARQFCDRVGIPNDW